jgi:hypothetical protein
MKTPVCFEDHDAKPIIEDLCKKHKIDMQLLIDLCDVVQKHSGSGRKEGVTNELASCIDSYLQRGSSR